MKLSEIPDYYERLGILRSATKDEIKSAYRKLVSIYHPDRNPGKEKESQIEFIAINEAFENVMKEKDSKSVYQQINFNKYKNKGFSVKEQMCEEIFNWAFNNKKF